MDIGFIGLGHMGLPMAINLIKNGYNVTGFDLLQDKLETLKKSGGNICANLQQMIQQQDVIITMLQTGEQVKSICFDESGIFNSASKLQLFIDCSSIDVETSRLIHHKLNELNILTLDAPVSGGMTGAKNAKLTFMVGGTHQALNQATPILKAMGQKIIYTGSPGNGQAAKICNNMILAISMIAISEGLLLGEKLGLDPKKLHEVVNNSSGQCWAMSNYVPLPGIMENVPANHNYQPGFSSTMMLKDLKLSQTSANNVKMHTPLGQHATELYQQLIDNQKGELDFSAIIQLLQNMQKNSH